MKYPCLLLPVVLLFAGGCAGINGLQDPVARVVAVRLVQQTDQGARVEVTINLQNPNGIPLPLVQSNYTVTVAGGGSYATTDYPERTLPASGQQQVTLPAVFATTTRLQNADFSVHGSIVYEPPGEMRKLLTNSGIPLPIAMFTGTGKLE